MTSDLSRRQLLITSAAALAAGALPTRRATALEPTSAKVPYRLGIASYSLRNFPLDKAIEMVKATQTRFVNFKSMHVPYEKTPAELQALRTQIEGAGLTTVGGGTVDFSKDNDDDVRRSFEYARHAGMPLMVAAPTRAILPRLERFVKEYNIQIAIHNHGPEDKNFPSPYDVLDAVKTLDPRIGLCMDIGHTARTGVDIARAARDAGPRLLDVHAKDLRDAKSRDSQCVVGQGVLPIAELLVTLHRIGYKGCVNLEYEIEAADPLRGMQLSMAVMRGMVAGIEVASG